MGMTKAERETVIRWDDESDDAVLYTASPNVARKWGRIGVELAEIRTRDGEVTGWEGKWPKRRIRTAKKWSGYTPTYPVWKHREAPVELVAPEQETAVPEQSVTGEAPNGGMDG